MNLRSPSNFHYIQALSVYIYIYFASPCSIMHVYQVYRKIEPKCLETQEKSRAGNCSKLHLSQKSTSKQSLKCEALSSLGLFPLL